jgi:hypothetical protein
MPNRVHLERSQGLVPYRSAGVLCALILVASLGGGPLARADEPSEYSWTPWNPCPHCDLLVGFGATYKFWAFNDGIVVPVTLEIDDSRWEVGVFRFATAQYLKEQPAFPSSFRAANPQWGFDALRRWQLLHRSWGKLYFGLGGSYKTENDWLDPRFDFAYMLGVRFNLGGKSILEFSVRHWSDAWFREPNRGVNFVMLSFGL